MMRTKKRFEDLTLQDDYMFSLVMRNKSLCKKCLERILNIEIADIQYPEYQKSINVALDAKGIRLDIYTENSDAVYNVEMQTRFFENLPKRGRYYQDLMDIDSTEKGNTYSNLKKSIVIFICTFDLYGKGLHLYSFENRCQQDSSILYGDETQKIILNTKGTVDDVPPALERFLNYIDTGNTTDEYTEELQQEVESVLHNKKWRKDYMTLEMRIDEERHFARKEGEVLTTVRLVLKKLSQQKSIEEISDFLEISSDSVVLIRDLAVQLDYDEEKITDTLINERRF